MHALFNLTSQVAVVCVDKELADKLRKAIPHYEHQPKEKIIQDLILLGVDVDEEIRSGRLRFHLTSDTYTLGGTFDRIRMHQEFRKMYDDTMAEGYAAFSAIGKLSLRVVWLYLLALFFVCGQAM